MKTLILTTALLFSGIINAQKGFEDYPSLLIPTYGVAYHSLIDDDYSFNTDELTEENTSIILGEVERILKLNGQDLTMTVRTIPEGVTYKDAYNPKGVVCLHYKVGDMMIYFGTWDDEHGTHVGFYATTHIED
jgi:hypothetical protein